MQHIRNNYVSVIVFFRCVSLTVALMGEVTKSVI